MLSIFICEDDLGQKKQLEKIIENYVLIEELDMHLALSTDNPYTLLDHLQEQEMANGLYFLDIDLGHEMNGIALAVEIKNLDPSGKIVFTTGRAELAPLTFKHKIEALDYIVKRTDLEAMKKDVLKCVQVAYDRQIATQKSSSDYFTFEDGGKISVVPLEEIMFIQTTSLEKRLEIHLENGRTQFKGRLKEIEQRHPVFIRVHHNILANQNNIASFNRKEMIITFTNDETCSISVRKASVLKQILTEKQS